MAQENNANPRVTVVGAYGHTGKFVVAELLRKGWTPVLAGRDAEKLRNLSDQYPQLEIRSLSVDNPATLDNALSGAWAVINCAGPFLDTAIPVVASALRMNVHYLDITGEQRCVLSIYERFSVEAQKKGMIVLPAMAFFGGLADLLATSAMDSWTSADTIDVSVALDSWMPTLGTRKTGNRNTYRRLIFSNGRLKEISAAKQRRTWNFSAPFGPLDVEEFPLSEVITMSKHLNVKEINTYLNLAPLQDIHDGETSPPTPIGEDGRSSQMFLMEVGVTSGKKVRKIAASGTDIYAVSAPLVVEALIRIEKGWIEKSGVVSAGEVFDSTSFLRSLSPEPLSISTLTSEI